MCPTTLEFVPLAGCTFTLIFVLSLSLKIVPQATVQIAASKTMLLYRLAASKIVQPLAASKNMQPLAAVWTTKLFHTIIFSSSEILQLSPSLSLNLLMK